MNNIKLDTLNNLDNLASAVVFAMAARKTPRGTMSRVEQWFNASYCAHSCDRRFEYGCEPTSSIYTAMEELLNHLSKHCLEIVRASNKHVGGYSRWTACIEHFESDFLRTRKLITALIEADCGGSKAVDILGELVAGVHLEVLFLTRKCRIEDYETPALHVELTYFYWATALCDELSRMLDRMSYRDKALLDQEQFLSGILCKTPKFSEFVKAVDKAWAAVGGIYNV